jgi:glycosyltransferase involved in cell wall biosynthesis
MTRSPDPRRTLVVIPAKDEGASLPAVLAGLRAAQPDLDVVVVDDGSTDDTAAVARAGGAVVLSLPFNLGIGGALRTGFRYAVRHGYRRGIQFDGDGQHDPTQIPLLLAALDDGAAMVIGNRFGGPGQSYQLSRMRAQAMGFLRFLVRQLSGTAFTDTSSGFRAFNHEVLELFAREYPAEYLESVEALLLACGAGFRVDEVPVHMRHRERGAPSNNRLHQLFHYLRVTLVITVTASPRRRAPRPGAGDDPGAPAGSPAPVEPAGGTTGVARPHHRAAPPAGPPPALAAAEGSEP